MEFSELVGKKVLFSGAKGNRIRIAGHTFSFQVDRDDNMMPFYVVEVPTAQGEEFPIRPPTLVTVVYVTTNRTTEFQLLDENGHVWLRVGLEYGRYSNTPLFQYTPVPIYWVGVYREKAQQINQDITQLSEIAHALDVIELKGLSDKLTNIIASLSRNLFDMNDVVSDNCNDEE